MEETLSRDLTQGDRIRAHLSTQELDDQGTSFDLRLEAVQAEANIVKELHQQLTNRFHQELTNIAAQIMVECLFFLVRFRDRELAF